MLGQKGRGEWSLVFFTLLTQMAVGSFSVWGLMWVFASSDISIPVNFSQSILGATLLLLVLGGMFAFWHLGNPFRAGYALSNLRSSWLSREGLLSGCFGLFVFWMFSAQNINISKIILTITCGFLLVLSISRLYMLRTVPVWNNLGTPATFFCSTVLLGVIVNASVWMTYLINSSDTLLNEIRSDPAIQVFGLMILIFVFLQLMMNAFTLISLNSKGGVAVASVRYLWMNLRVLLIVRWLTAICGMILLLFGGFLLSFAMYFYISFALVWISELLGRFLFYRSYRREGF